MHHTEALNRVRSLLRRNPDEAAKTTDEAFSGPNLIDQEPDLAKESARRSVRVSGWSAGGQPTD